MRKREFEGKSEQKIKSFVFIQKQSYLFYAILWKLQNSTMSTANIQDNSNTPKDWFKKPLMQIRYSFLLFANIPYINNYGLQKKKEPLMNTN